MRMRVFAVLVGTLFGALPALAQTPLPELGDVVIAEIRIDGHRRLDEAAIRVRIGSQAGERYDPAQVARDIREIHALGFFSDVRARAEDAATGLRLIFEVDEHPVIREIQITGTELFNSDEILERHLTLTTGSTLDPVLVMENGERIQALYEANGYRLAEVASEVQPIDDATSRVVYTVIEHDKTWLREINFHGNEHFSDDELEALYHTRPWRFWSFAASWFDYPWLGRPGEYSEPIFSAELGRVAATYIDAGYVRVEIEEPVLHVSPDGLRVDVTIEEGRRFSVGAVDVIIVGPGDVEFLKQKLQLIEGEVFHRNQLRADVRTLETLYLNRGFVHVSVTPLTEFGFDPNVVHVNYSIRTGPRYYEKFFLGVLERHLF